jgi:glycerophosphoryl diester phosphodiesterase
MTGWFTEDFTLAEIKTLRARERLPGLRPRNCAYDGIFAVPTFDEIMQLATDTNRRRGSAARIGVYPETKHPAHFAALGLPQERAVLQTLERFDYAGKGAPVFIQSFDPNNLRELREMTALPLVQLLEYGLGDLRVVADYADAVGVAKSLASIEGIANAHDLDLSVHVWTFRAENEFLPADLRIGAVPSDHGDLDAEIRRYLGRGIDGFFTDFPAAGVRARNAYISAVQPEHHPATATNLPGNRLHGR